ncbi:hypothetical protein ACFL96_12440 [Thermoproteota archaeon]
MNNNRSGTAAVLSFVFSGLGQLYNGQILKGLVIIAFTAASLFANVVGAVLIYLWLTQRMPSGFLWGGITVFAIGFLAICFIGIYSIVDAHKTGAR